jgi:hypothetical protein
MTKIQTRSKRREVATTSAARITGSRTTVAEQMPRRLPAAKPPLPGAGMGPFAGAQPRTVPPKTSKTTSASQIAPGARPGPPPWPPGFSYTPAPEAVGWNGRPAPKAKPATTSGTRTAAAQRAKARPTPKR